MMDYGKIHETSTTSGDSTITMLANFKDNTSNNSGPGPGSGSSATSATTQDQLHFLDSLRHQELSPSLITTFLVKLCDSKFSQQQNQQQQSSSNNNQNNNNNNVNNNNSEELLAKFANIVVEKLICESPLTEILNNLDTQEFQKKFYNNTQFDYNKFLIFCRYLCSSDKQGYDILAVTFFSSVWKYNIYFQYGVIKYCIFSDWIQQILNSCTITSLTKKVPQIEMLKCPIEYETDYQIYCWKYQCLTQILLDLSENQMICAYLEEIFFLPLNKCPDLLVFALLECHGNQKMKEVVLVKALLKFICVSPNNPNPNPNATSIIQKIWPSDFVYTAKTSLSWSQKALLTSMVELYTASSQEEQSYKLSKILDLSQDLKVLNVLLSSNTYAFVIDLACFASRREYLKLDKWLNDKIHQIGQQFVEACIKFLKRRCVIFGASEQATMLPTETYRIILNCLRNLISESASSPLEIEIIKMCNKFAQWMSSHNHNNQIQNVNIQNQQATNLKSITQPNQFDSVGSQQQFVTENSIRSPQLSSQQPPLCLEMEREFSKEIEDETDSYFQRIYNQDLPDALTIDQFLEMLKKFQQSNLDREKEIAACMIRNLFKEYPFLSQYPDKELVITGELFGGIIKNDFVKGYLMVQALRSVLEALKKPLNTRYITFCKAALNKLKSRLKEFPQFCQHLCSEPLYRHLPANLIEYIEYGKQSLDPPSAMQAKRITKMVTPGTGATTTGSNENNIAQLTEMTPPNAFQDKISFIINNLSQINLAKKAEEFKELFLKEKELYLQWFSNYFVMKRVSLEANFHELYATFIFKVNIVDLSTKILFETYRNIKILLRTSKETDNFNDRTLLKNLGQWLGLITLAQNKPILTIHLDLKSLLIEAYHKGLHQLKFVVPFVSKVLLGTAKSRVFRPPCPWTVKLLKILVELQSEPDLKLTLKFEVEVLCNKLKTDLQQYVGKSQDLKNKDLYIKLEHQLGVNSMPMTNLLPQNNVNLDQGVVPPGLLHQATTFDSNPVSVAPNAAPHVPVSNFNPVVALQNYPEVSLAQSINIQPNLQILMISPNIKVIIRNIIEKCVQDWIGFISDKVTKVCITTTETLVKKDFAHEPNADVMRNAAYNMVRSLVSGYALISTEEPLLNRLQSSLIQFFSGKSIPSNISKELIDSTVSTLVNDNIENCVYFIQKTCIDRAIDEIEKRMKPDFDQRQSTKSDGKKVTTTTKQMQIYEEMGRSLSGLPTNSTPNYSQTENARNSLPNAVTSNVMANHNYSMVQTPNVASAPAEPAAMKVQIQVDSIVVIYDKLIKHLNELIQEFHYPNEVMHQTLEILKVCKQTPRDAATAQALIKNAILGLKEMRNNADTVTDFSVISRVRDFYLLLLKALTDQRAFNLRFTTTQITRFLLEFWIVTPGQSFPDDLFDTLYRTDLINFSLMDQEFHQFLENGSNTTAITIILNFLKYYLSSINPQNFISTVDFLQRITARLNQNNPLFNDLKNILALTRVQNVQNNEVIDTSSANEKFEIIINEWITLCNSDKNLNVILTHMWKNMSSQGLLKNEETIQKFFKFFTELCVERCYQILTYAAHQNHVSTSDIHTKCNEFIEAFTILVLSFLKQSGIERKLEFLSRIFNFLASTAYRDHEIRRNEFFPFPYYRILLTIFIELYATSSLGNQEIMINNENCSLDLFKFHLIQNYCGLLHLISPLKLPSFVFAWLNFISHRVFIAKCLDNITQINHKTWHSYFTLLRDLLMFLSPFLQRFHLFSPNAATEIYKATLKLFLLLYHDFPEFLCEYCYNLLDLIPFRAVQLRNIILSANPINIPDVLNQKVDNLFEMIPPIRFQNQSLLKIPFQKELETYLRQRVPATFVQDLCKSLYFNSENFDDNKQPIVTGLNTSLVNALTFQLGLSAIQQSNRTLNTATIGSFTQFEIFNNLLLFLDSHGRYVLINSIVDHLRYPNTETLFFICILLGLFKINEEPIREQIIRVLLERLVAKGPHPWGLQYVVAELKRNSSYKLFEHNFIKHVPEIEAFLKERSS